ncbi:cholesterol 25-hydroxylase-like protein 1, member 1 [Bombina bombina]|uniref:cholesterol 25-hydroxylase-like protein 1, member 1 n=1 Tax=Bombina bombina TaxID=8345 RepID=UPI00235A4EF1|nr:cholesterol 25-hydroxylase-like protein 1, member 1 [Bombina bombina]
MNSSTACSHHLLIQPFWDYIIYEFGDLVSTPFFPVILAFSGFIFFSFPFTIVDLLGERCNFLYRYKIQKDKRPTMEMMGRCIWRAFFNHLVYVLPTILLNWFWFPSAPLPAKAPSVDTFLVEVIGCLLLFDFQYFIWHVLHHKNHWLYKKVHSIHHKYVAPFSWSSQNLGGYELMTLGFWSSTNPVRLGCHPLTSWTCNLVSICMSVDDHIGYNFPWSLSNVLPFDLYGGAVAHDMHHQRPDTNFAPFFGHWDMIFGTSSNIINRAPNARE